MDELILTKEDFMPPKKNGTNNKNSNKRPTRRPSGNTQQRQRTQAKKRPQQKRPQQNRRKPNKKRTFVYYLSVFLNSIYDFYQKNFKKQNKNKKSQKQRQKQRNAKKTNRKSRAVSIAYAIKVIFSIVLTILAANVMKQSQYFYLGLIDLFVIMAISNVIYEKNQRVGRIFNNVIMFLYNVQYLFLYFAAQFISPMILTNIDSIEAIRGRAGIYIVGSILVIIISFLPMQHIGTTSKKIKRIKPLYWFINNIMSKKMIVILLIVQIIAISALPADKNKSEPLTAAVDTIATLSQSSALTNELEDIANSKDTSYAEKFYQSYLVDETDEGQSMWAEEGTQNAVVLFIEGLSCEVIEHELNPCPNIREFMEEDATISFENYYNHTYATYRGLEGQLFSGFQHSNMDKNNLVGIHTMLEEHGKYETTFINTEKSNKTFTAYVENLGFKNVEHIDYKNYDLENYSGGRVIPDKYSFEYLYDYLEDNYDPEKRMFTAMYTIGTHASFDSYDKKFEDGENRFLNKFYDMDAAFGEFLEKFKESPISDNTLLVLTTDHSTHREQEYVQAFPGVNTRTQMQRIPFCIYSKNVDKEENKVIDASGRTSLDFAPTLLDYMEMRSININDNDNFFLGRTLFALDVPQNIEHLCNYADEYAITTPGEEFARECTEQEKNKFKPILQDYYKAMFGGYKKK